MRSDFTSYMRGGQNTVSDQDVGAKWYLLVFSILYFFFFISSAEPKANRCAYRMGRHWLSVCRPPFSKILFSETTWPIKAKFYMKHLQEGGTNLYIDNRGHMTKMATMPIYSEKLQNLLLRNWWTNFNETWHEALMTQVLQCFI